MCHEGAAIGLQFCCALELTHNGEQYALLFPGYELPKIQKLTELPAPELPAAAPEKKRKAAPKKHPPNGEKIRPLFYWRIPKGENVALWFTPLADVEFQAAHPRLYTFLVILAIALLVAPMAGYLSLTTHYFPDANSPWLLLGSVGGFLVGCSLFNILAAWLHQYFGHIVTICLAVLGFALMAISCLLL